MKVEQAIMMRDSDGKQLIDENTVVTIRWTDAERHRVTRKGNWYQDQILDCMDREVHGIHWYPEGSVFIDV